MHVGAAEQIQYMVGLLQDWLFCYPFSWNTTDESSNGEHVMEEHSVNAKVHVAAVLEHSLHALTCKDTMQST